MKSDVAVAMLILADRRNRKRSGTGIPCRNAVTVAPRELLAKTSLQKRNLSPARIRTTLSAEASRIYSRFEHQELRFIQNINYQSRVSFRRRSPPPPP